MQRQQLFLSDFNETWIFSTDFRKTLNIKFHKNPSNVKRVQCGRTDGRADRYDEANSRFSILLMLLKLCTVQWTLINKH